VQQRSACVRLSPACSSARNSRRAGRATAGASRQPARHAPERERPNAVAPRVGGLEEKNIINFIIIQFNRRHRRIIRLSGSTVLAAHPLLFFSGSSASAAHPLQRLIRFSGSSASAAHPLQRLIRFSGSSASAAHPLRNPRVN